MNTPQNMVQPFFAYGIFRPGQLAYFQLRDLVEEIADPAQCKGKLLLRDGLPIMDLTGTDSVEGALLTFAPGKAQEAYERISAMEPDSHYRWTEARVNENLANVLLGRFTAKGSIVFEEPKWDGWTDPLFTSALDVIEETLNTQEFDWNLKPLFRLQMAYLLLWSAIERYVSLRYHLGKDVANKVRQLAQEAAFASGLLMHVKERREVYRADQPDNKVVLDPQDPRKSLEYFYQLRSNLSHRGKGVVRDYDRIQEALAQLLPIFREVLRTAQTDAETAPDFASVIQVDV